MASMNKSKERLEYELKWSCDELARKLMNPFAVERYYTYLGIDVEEKWEELRKKTYKRHKAI